MTALDTVLAEAHAHHKAGRLAEAEASYRAALGLAPGRTSVRHNLAVVLAASGAHAAALAEFDAAIAVEPGYASAHYNRGVALQKLGRSREAIAALTRAAALEPGQYEAHRALGFLWLGEHDRGRALDHFARTYELRRGEDRDGAALASLTHASAGKLRHDTEQFRYLAIRRRDARRFEALARAYEQVARELPEKISALSERQIGMLGDHYNTSIDIADAPEVAGGALDPALDWAAIERPFIEQAPGAVWCDGVLSPAALAGIRRTLLESTIWHDFSHIGGFVASYLEDGLACPLLLQIADELRARLPRILGPHALTQAWAFKGFEQSASVAAHADDAAVSVNLWLTPTSANLDPAAGGLVVCRRAPPLDWQIRGYDADTTEIDAFMQAHADSALTVLYRENRAVLFDARLFHRSAAPHFRPGYENHRINLTLLYGKTSWGG